MPSNAALIGEYLRPGRRVHLIGIGGVSMRPLGLVLHDMGVEISGSDMSNSPATDGLLAQGIPVAIGIGPKTLRVRKPLSAPPPSTTTTRKSPPPVPWAFPFLSVLRPVATL